jgi:hypothetical protein
MVQPIAGPAPPEPWEMVQRRAEHFPAAINCGSERLARNLSAGCVAAQVVNDRFGGFGRAAAPGSKHYDAGRHDKAAHHGIRREPNGHLAGRNGGNCGSELSVELCFPQLDQPRQSFMPFSKIENDAP